MGIFGHLLENDYTSHTNPAPTRTEINTTKAEQKSEKEKHEEELRQDEIDAENRAQYSRQVDGLDTPYGCADQYEKDDD